MLPSVLDRPTRVQGWCTALARGTLLVAGGCLTIALTLVVAYQVGSRHIDLLPRLLWTEEAARFSFVWSLFLVSAVAVRQGSHLVVEVFERRSRWHSLLVTAVVSACALYLVIGGLRFVAMSAGRVSPTAGIPMVWVLAAIPISGVLMLVFCTEQVIALIRRWPDPTSLPPQLVVEGDLSPETGEPV